MSGSKGQIKNECVSGIRSEYLGRVGSAKHTFFFWRKYNFMHSERHFGKNVILCINFERHFEGQNA